MYNSKKVMNMLSNYILKKANITGKADAKQREEVGRMTSYVGISLNICLSAMKILSGMIFNSVSILADGVNNLSDAGNSLILLISFKLSSKEADEEHPFGHERFEYLASCFVALSILFLAVEMFRSSFDKILHPSDIDFSILLVVVLSVSILGKLALYKFYKNCAKPIDSTVLEASAQDSINDVYSTSAVLISTLIFRFAHLNLDGYMGIAVAVLIFMSGISIIKEAANKILGEAPDKDFVASIEKRVCSYKGVYGIHDLMVHSYGPNRCFVSVHAEVDSKEDILVSHDLIDRIEKDFLEDGIHLVIHMDPIVLDDPLINQLKDDVNQCVRELSNELRVHDFRAVLGKTHSNLIFDCVIPYSCKITKEEIEKHLEEMLSKKDEIYYCVITFERPYNG